MWTMILCVYKRKEKKNKVLPLNNVAADAENQATGDSNNAQNRRSLGERSSKGKSVVMPAEKVNEKIDP